MIKIALLLFLVLGLAGCVEFKSVHSQSYGSIWNLLGVIAFFVVIVGFFVFMAKMRSGMGNLSIIFDGDVFHGEEENTTVGFGSTITGYVEVLPEKDFEGKMLVVTLKGKARLRKTYNKKLEYMILREDLALESDYFYCKGDVERHRFEFEVPTMEELTSGKGLERNKKPDGALGVLVDIANLGTFIPPLPEDTRYAFYVVGHLIPTKGFDIWGGKQFYISGLNSFKVFGFGND